VSLRSKQIESRPAATLLVVDDEPQNVALLVEVFEHGGYKALAAGSGPEALEVARAQKPDAILLDLMMPGMDGFEVLRRLRADAETRHMPVMVITAKYLEEPEQKFLTQNAQHIFMKGAFLVEDLLKGVERVLARGAAS